MEIEDTGVRVLLVMGIERAMIALQVM